MRALLEPLFVPEAASVEVSRTGPDAQGGYTWTVTFLLEAGDLPIMQVHETSLTGTDAALAVHQVTAGNMLDGTYTLTGSRRSGFRTDIVLEELFDAAGRLVDGDKPTKEMPLHSAFYETRSTAGAVVHLHSCHAVAWSLMPEADADNFLPPLTPYAIMKLGKVKLLPFFVPGDPAMGKAVRGLAGKRSAVMLANHGPVVAGKDVEAACNAIEELEDTARLAILMRGIPARRLTDAQIDRVVTEFKVEWD